MARAWLPARGVVVAAMDGAKAVDASGAIVELQAGPFRVVSLMTREGADELADGALAGEQQLHQLEPRRLAERAELLGVEVEWLVVEAKKPTPYGRCARGMTRETSIGARAPACRRWCCASACE